MNAYRAGYEIGKERLGDEHPLTVSLKNSVRLTASALARPIKNTRKSRSLSRRGSKKPSSRLTSVQRAVDTTLPEISNNAIPKIFDN